MVDCQEDTFLIVKMPGIHSAKGPLSQRTEQSSCVSPDIAS